MIDQTRRFLPLAIGSMLGAPSAMAQPLPPPGAGTFLPLSGGALTGGISFGSVNAASSSDLSKHIALFGTTTGFSVTSSNTITVMVAGTAAVSFSPTTAIFASGLRINGNVGFYNTATVAKQTVSGAWAGSTAGKALCVALATYGFITDSTTA